LNKATTIFLFVPQQILKATWVPVNIAKHDMAAKKNWKDFTEGKLEVHDEVLRAHLISHTNQRPTSLEELTKQLEGSILI